MLLCQNLKTRSSQTPPKASCQTCPNTYSSLIISLVLHSHSELVCAYLQQTSVSFLEKHLPNSPGNISANLNCRDQLAGINEEWPRWISIDSSDLYNDG